MNCVVAIVIIIVRHEILRLVVVLKSQKKKMHEISSEFYNGNSNGLFSSRRVGLSAAEKLSQRRYGGSRDYLDDGNDECTRNCDCVACSYLEFKQITGLGSPVATTATTPTTVGILGVAPPYSQCKSMLNFFGISQMQVH